MINDDDDFSCFTVVDGRMCCETCRLVSVASNRYKRRQYDAVFVAENITVYSTAQQGNSWRSSQSKTVRISSI